MKTTVHIVFTDGSMMEIQGYRVIHDDTLLSIRTSYNGAYQEAWSRFPLVNIKHWSTE